MLRGIAAVGVLPKLAARTALHRASARAIRKSDEAREAQEHALLAASLIVLGAGTCNAKLAGCPIEAAPGKLPEIFALMRNQLPGVYFFRLFLSTLLPARARRLAIDSEPRIALHYRAVRPLRLHLHRRQRRTTASAQCNPIHCRRGCYFSAWVASEQGGACRCPPAPPRAYRANWML